MTGFDATTGAGAEADRRLRTDTIGWLTTVARDGTPQSSIVAFLWDGETVTVWSEPEAPKVRNLVENHRCSFHLNTAEQGAGMVSIEGTARLVPDGPLWDRVPEYMEKYGAVARDVWDVDLHHHAPRYSQVIEITPRRIRIR
jgi:PPOX class probable F420-dependent enzyme